METLEFKQKEKESCTLQYSNKILDIKRYDEGRKSKIKRMQILFFAVLQMMNHPLKEEMRKRRARYEGRRLQKVVV